MTCLNVSAVFINRFFVSLSFCVLPSHQDHGRVDWLERHLLRFIIDCCFWWKIQSFFVFPSQMFVIRRHWLDVSDVRCVHFFSQTCLSPVHIFIKGLSWTAKFCQKQLQSIKNSMFGTFLWSCNSLKALSCIIMTNHCHFRVCTPVHRWSNCNEGLELALSVWGHRGSLEVTGSALLDYTGLISSCWCSFSWITAGGAGNELLL